MTETSPFASRSVAGHLARGFVAAALIAWAFSDAGAHPVWVAGAWVGALVFLRGCPTCWTIGLCETVAATRRERSGG